MTTQYGGREGRQHRGRDHRGPARAGRRPPTVHYVYVLKRLHELVGVLSLALVLTDDARPVRDVMPTTISATPPDETGGRCARHLQIRASRHYTGCGRAAACSASSAVDDAWDAARRGRERRQGEGRPLKVLASRSSRPSSSWRCTPWSCSRSSADAAPRTVPIRRRREWASSVWEVASPAVESTRPSRLPRRTQPNTPKDLALTVAAMVGPWHHHRHGRQTTPRHLHRTRPWARSSASRHAVGSSPSCACCLPSCR